MKNIKKRKVLTFIIFALCTVISIAIFLILKNWFHSYGVHFIGSYGQIHISQMCEGIDQDGNKTIARNVVIDGVITRNQEFSGTITIDGLPEMDGVLPAGAAEVKKQPGGLYEFYSCIFHALPAWYKDPDPLARYKKEYKEELDKSCYATVWLKAEQIAIEFHVGDTHSKEYYIFYSDNDMFDIVKKNIKIYNGL